MNALTKRGAENHKRWQDALNPPADYDLNAARQKYRNLIDRARRHKATEEHLVGDSKMAILSFDLAMLALDALIADQETELEILRGVDDE